MVIGKHIVADFWEPENKKVFSDKDYVKELVIKCVEVSNSKLFWAEAWEFGGEKGGISTIAIVYESHIAIHSWKNYNYLTIDIYTCGESSDPEKALEFLIKELKPKKVVKKYLNRSSERRNNK